MPAGVSCSLFSGPEGDRRHYVFMWPPLCKRKQTLRTLVSLWGSLALDTLSNFIHSHYLSKPVSNTNRGRVKALVFEFERHRYHLVWEQISSLSSLESQCVTSLRLLSDSYWLSPISFLLLLIMPYDLLINQEFLFCHFEV